MNKRLKLIYIFLLVCFVVLAVTGFYPLINHKPLSGYLLILHTIVSGVMALALALLALLFGSTNNTRQALMCGTHWLVVKIVRFFFWLIMIVAIPLILSILLSMFPLFAPEEQRLLLWLHQWSAIVFAGCVVIQALFIPFLKIKSNK